MKKIKYIEVEFENCEVYKVPQKGISYFQATNLIRNLINFTNSDGVIDSYNCDKLALSIYKEDATRMKNNFGDKEFEMRIKHQDITHLYVKFVDGEEISIICPWKSVKKNAKTWEDRNKLQKVQNDNEITVILTWN